MNTNVKLFNALSQLMLETVPIGFIQQLLVRMLGELLCCVADAVPTRLLTHELVEQIGCCEFTVEAIGSDRKCIVDRVDFTQGRATNFAKSPVVFVPLLGGICGNMLGTRLQRK